MAQVRIISTDIIKSVNKNGEISTDRKRVELTPWDLNCLPLFTTQFGLLFHKPKSSTPPINLIHHLKLTLARTLDFYPPLAGRLRLVTNDDDGTSSFFIDCNNAGALFLYATADHVMVRDIDTPDVPPVLSSFFHFLVRICYEGTSKPLLAVQVTELADGVFIACTVNTLLVDASSLWHFLTSWSEISRGLNHISRSPVIDRWFPSDVNFPIRLPFSPEGLKVASADNHLPLEEWHFHFTKEKIAALKAKSNAEMRTTTISSFQALLAHIWRGVVRCRKPNAEHLVGFTIYVNDRKRLQPPLPNEYFGMAVRGERVTATAGELLSRGLGWGAWQINMAVSRQTDDAVRNFLRSWAANPEITAIPDDEIVTSGSPLYDIYGFDLGWGKPILPRCGIVEKTDGNILFFGGAEEGSINVRICLLPEALHVLLKDKEFMEAVESKAKDVDQGTKPVFSRSFL